MRRAARGLLAVLFAAITVLWGAALPASAADVGFVGPVYGTSTTAPTGQKPQSKLWVADGIWWGALFDSVSRDFHIFRYDWAGNGWSDTGVLIDERTNVYVDALWDGQHLYVVSAGTSSTTTTHSPRLIRFSYDTGTKTWSRDAGYPISPMGNGGVEAAVIAKDSTGLLWATFTQGSKVYVVHSTPGDDRTWVQRYQLPTPAGQSSVDPDDISAIVSYDGDKIGVLWSNQVAGVETMYWAWHQDGTSDQTWTVQVVYQQPEGADDHMNLKSLVGDSNGRVFAVAKTSMDAASDPLFNLFVLSATGQWSATQIWSQADDSTRAIVQIDEQARELYVFAAAPCCSGGTIYYKKSGLDNPQFPPGLGTPFISSAAHPEANNPTSTKQNVNGTTGLVVMAGDDQTRAYLYNRLTLGGPPSDTTPPETTITSDPAASTTATGATFAFTSSEPGSTFACQLDGGTAADCTSPQSYTGLDVGPHTFTVTATDPAGNDDPTPAAQTWSVQGDTTPPETTINSGPAATTTSTGATFEFTSSEPGSTFSCQLGSDSPEVCTSPQSYPGLGVGAHTFTVTATDPAGNTDPTPATHDWSIEADTTPPETAITSGPAATTTATGAAFEFTSSEPGSTFACQLDGSLTTCTSPQSYTGLSAGAHTFSVTATDPAGNTGPAATHPWMIQVLTIFSDSFLSGSFAVGGWDVRVGGSGTATVESGAVHPTDLGARLVSTGASASSASIRKSFAPQQRLTLSWDARVAQGHTGQAFALAKIYGSGGRVLSLMRNASGALSVEDVGSTTVIPNTLLTNDQVARLCVAVVQGTTDSVTVSIDGVQVFSSSSMNLGSSAFDAVRMGDDAKRRTLDYRVDDLLVTS